MSVAESNHRDESLHELRRAVFILAEQVGRITAEKQLKEENILKPPLTQRFLDQVALMGVSDAIKAKRPILKAIWVVVFIATFAITAFLVIAIIRRLQNASTQYFSESPSGWPALYPYAIPFQVDILRNTTYSYPSIVLCLDTWFSLKKATDLGFSKNAVEYAMQYLMRYEDFDSNLQKESDQAKCSDRGQQDFLDVYSRLNFSNLLDFYEDIALDTIPGDHFSNISITFNCKGCPKNTTRLEKVVVDRGVCYQVPLMAEAGKLRGSDGFWRLAIQAPDLSGGLMEKKLYWRLYINTELSQIQPTAMFLSVDKSATTAITISGQRFRMASTLANPCVHRGNPYLDMDSSAVRCATKCLCDSAQKRFGCRVLSLETDDFQRPPEEYCNRCSWKKTSPDSHERNEDDFQTCLDSCPHECEIWMYDGTVDRHSSSSLQAKLDRANNNSEIHYEAVKIYFKNGAVLRGGILTFTELFTYSLETLIGTIGGTCGIWISVGVLTLVQLLIFLVRTTSKGFCAGKSFVARKLTSAPLNDAPLPSHLQTSKI